MRAYDAWDAAFSGMEGDIVFALMGLLIIILLVALGLTMAQNRLLARRLESRQTTIDLLADDHDYNIKQKWSMEKENGILKRRVRDLEEEKADMRQQEQQADREHTAQIGNYEHRINQLTKAEV